MLNCQFTADSACTKQLCQACDEARAETVLAVGCWSRRPVTWAGFSAHLSRRVGCGWMVLNMGCNMPGASMAGGKYGLNLEGWKMSCTEFGDLIFGVDILQAHFTMHGCA